MTRFLIVCGSGAVGCGVRYLVGVWTVERFGTRIPYGTLIVNIVGSFLITLVMELSIRLVEFPPNLRLALTVGFLGGLTTYSTFNLETTQLVFSGHTVRALAHVVGTVVACFAAGLLGILIARRFGG